MNRTSEVMQEQKFLEFEKMYPPFFRDLETDLCLPQVAEGWEWCFDPSKCYLLEKLNGTNVKLEVENKHMTIWVRNQVHKRYVEATLNDPQYKYIVQGVTTAIANRSKAFSDGTYFGEVIGEKYQGNPYRLHGHTWMTFKPFSGGAGVYKDYPKSSNYEEWKTWMLNLKSILNPDVFAEGVIFLNKETGQMAKLRRDMFDISLQPKRNKYKKRK